MNKEFGIKDVLDQMNARLNHIEARLMNLESGKADKWEIRIWFLVIVILMTVYHFWG